MAINNLIEESKEDKTLMEQLQKLFIEFYSNFYKDEHASSFLTSFTQVKSLIEKQSLTISKIINSIKQNNTEEVYKEFLKTAKRHYELGVFPKAMFDSINVYTRMLSDKKILERKHIKLIKSILEETTAKIYIKGYINEAISFLENERKLKVNSKYDDYFYSKVISHLKKLIEFIDSSENLKMEALLFVHTNCGIAKFLEGIGFQIMSHGREINALKLKAVHKAVHEYTKSLFSYIEKHQYCDAVYMALNIIDNVYKLLYLYSNLALRWRDNKKDIVSNYTLTAKKDSKTYLLILKHEEHIKISQDLRRKIFNILENYFLDFSFIFFDEIQSKDTIDIFINQKSEDFSLKLENLITDLTKLAEELSFKYVSISDRPILKIAKFDLSAIERYFANEEEILELYREIKNKLEKETSNNVIKVIDYSQHINDIVKSIKNNLSIKEVSIKQLKKENVELFAHKIFTMDRKLFGVEILGRIKDTNTNEYIPAGRFIKVFEKNNLMEEFDRIIIKKVKENLKEIKQITKNIFVNIYPSSLSYDPVVDELKQLIGECDKEKINLFLELTEYTIISNKEIFEFLKSDRFTIVFDDFGTGYTNYELIGELGEKKNAKVIKIDGSIVKKSKESKIYTSILESITLFSDSLGMKTVYEFVENEEVFEKIKEIAKSLNLKTKNILLQGFYLHVPAHYKELILPKNQVKDKK